MKAIILTSILVVLSLTNVVAGNPRTKVLSNIENRENGCTKEYTFVDDELRPESRYVYQYSADGAMLSKTVYIWDSQEGWIGAHKYDYEYNRSGQVANLIFTSWDKDLEAWSPQCQHLLHIYNLDGELLSVKQVKVNNEMGLIAGK